MVNKFILPCEVSTGNDARVGPRSARTAFTRAEVARANTSDPIAVEKSGHADLGEAHYYRERYTIAMDMIAPFCVYVNGQRVAEYDDESAADEHFLRLRTQHLINWARKGRA